MKKTFLFILAIFCFAIPFANFSIGNVMADSEQVEVIVEKCNLYSSADLESEVVLQLNFGDLLDLESSSLLAGVQTDFQFYNISIIVGDVEKTGYVISTFVMDSSINELDKKLDPNAKTSKIAQIYIKNGADYENMAVNEENVILEKDQDIKIIDGYNKSKEYHQIMFEIGDDIYEGYIKTSDITVEGFNGTIIIVVFIFILVASVAISIYLRTRKKRKKIKKSAE